MTLKFPSAYTILIVLIVLIALLTWIVPAGSYEYHADGEPIAGTYSEVERNAQGFGDIVLAPLEGLYDAIDVAVFILMVGGFLGVIMETGAITAGIGAIVQKLKGKEKLLIPILMVVFALGGTTFGMAEETIAFYPLILPIVIAAGYDALTGVSIIMLGAGAGVLASTINPFATGIASGFAGISLGDGLVLRLLILIIILPITIWYVMHYGQKVRDNPSASLVANMRESNLAHFVGEEKIEELNGRQKIALVIFALAFLVMIYAVIPFEDLGLSLPSLGWWFPELSALFLVSGIIIGLVYGLKEDKLIESFLFGAKDLLGVAFIIGISRGISVIMTNGMITDTILYWGERTLAGNGPVVFLSLMYLIFIPLSVLIPSTSGLATLSMSVLAPLADFAGIGRDLVITAFQSASGLVNLLTPTSAVVMGGLAIGRVGYNLWLKFVWRLILILLVLSLALLLLGIIL